MENAINVSFTPLQVLLSLAFQIWFIVFPILIIRKLNYLIALFEDQDDSKKDQTA